MLQIVQIAVLNDNYIYLLHDQATGETAVVDPAVGGPVKEMLSKHGWTLTHIINTHHHGDHTGANIELKKAYGAIIIGPDADRDRIPGIDQPAKNEDTIYIGESKATAFDVPGHTKGHNAYYFADDGALFCGDTMFAMGCGRLFEGTPGQMKDSLEKLANLPDETKVYCAHEYTAANGAFALSVEPDNEALTRRMADVKAKRMRGKPTIPSTIGLEKATNPFLRSHSLTLQKSLGKVGATPVEVFAETRKRKDNFWNY